MNLILARLEGRFLLSLNDTPEIRATLAAFELEPVRATSGMARGASATAGELIIGDGRESEAPEIGQGELI